MKYVYSVLRFVPDPARGEFVNIGAIVGSDESSEWELKLISNQRRARLLDDRGVISSLWSYLGDVSSQIDGFVYAAEEGIEPAQEISEKWLDELSRDFNNVLQITKPSPLLSKSLGEALSIVFDQFVIDPTTDKLPYERRTVATAAIRRAYLDYGLHQGAQFFEKPIVRGAHHRARFDFAVANGKAVQLAHTFSLQLPDAERLLEEIKAWAFTVEEIRDSGATAVKNAKNILVPRDVPVVVVYVPPAAGRDSVLDEARSAFSRAKAEAVPVSDVALVGRRAHDALAKVG